MELRHFICVSSRSELTDKPVSTKQTDGRQHGSPPASFVSHSERSHESLLRVPTLAHTLSASKRLYFTTRPHYSHPPTCVYIAITRVVPEASSVKDAQ